MVNVAAGNLLFIRTLIQSPRHKINLSEAVAYLSESNSQKFQDLITLIREFNEFNKDNDPYGEKDFGRVTLGDKQYFFKIDLYDSSWEWGWDSSSNTEPCRLLNIMETCEY